jgi:hypothetical protein
MQLPDTPHCGLYAHTFPHSHVTGQQTAPPHEDATPLVDKEKQIKAKERLLNKKESSLKKIEQEQLEHIQQLASLKTMVTQLEKKILILEEENRLLKIQLLSATDVLSSRPDKLHTTSENNCNSRCSHTNFDPSTAFLLPALSTLTATINQLAAVVSNCSAAPQEIHPRQKYEEHYTKSDKSQNVYKPPHKRHYPKKNPYKIYYPYPPPRMDFIEEPYAEKPTPTRKQSPQIKEYTSRDGPTVSPSRTNRSPQVTEYHHGKGTTTSVAGAAETQSDRNQRHSPLTQHSPPTSTPAETETQPAALDLSIRNVNKSHSPVTQHSLSKPTSAGAAETQPAPPVRSTSNVSHSHSPVTQHSPPMKTKIQPPTADKQLTCTSPIITSTPNASQQKIQHCLPFLWKSSLRQRFGHIQNSPIPASPLLEVLTLMA